MMRTLRYRLYPTPQQRSVLSRQIALCQQLYNTALEQRIVLYRQRGVSLGKHQQINELPGLKLACPQFTTVHSQVLQNVLVRLDRAFESFFTRRSDARAGFPRFRAINRYDSLTYPQSGFRVSTDRRRVQLSKVGLVKLTLHRPIPKDALLKTCTIKRSGDHWYILFAVELPDRVALPVADRPAVGIDLGLEAFATYSTGERIANPRWLRRSEEKIRGHQRNGARAKAARVHRKIASQRRDFQHKLSRSIVRSFGVVAVEDLNIRQMIAQDGKNLQKSLHDAGWGRFLGMLRYKAEEAGTKLVEVDPRGTSERCSGCRARVVKQLSCREHRCPGCGLVLDRDHNAALNILMLGRSMIAGRALPAL